MREQVVRQTVDRGLRLARIRTRLTTTNLAPPSLSPARPSVSAAAGGLPCVPSVCPQQNLHPQPSSAASSSSSCSCSSSSSTLLSASPASQSARVFSQTNSASSSTATVTASRAFPGALQVPVAAATTASPPVTTEAVSLETQSAVRVRNLEEMPGPKGYPVVGTLLEYFRKENRGRMHEIQRRNHRLYGNIFMEPFGPAKNVCVADPAIVEEILRSEGPYPNRPPYESWVLYNNLRKRRGGIMTSQGEYWKASRRTMHGKLMKPEAVGRFIEGLNATTAEFIARIRQLKEERDWVQQLPFEINKFTMEAVGRMLLNVRIGTLDPDISPKIKQFIEAIGTMFLTGHQLMAFARVHQILRTKVWTKHVEAWDTIYALSNELIAVQVDEARRRLEEDGALPREEQDLISHMVSAGTLTREEIIDNLTETFMGGVDTVANGVSFMLYLLSVNESAQSKLRAEVDSVLGQRSCSQEDLHDMPYVKAVVKETLRLYPPIPLNARVTQEEQVIANYRIPKGTIIMLNNYTMSRDERIFAEPDSFLPDRWLRADVASWHPFSAIPFGYGVRSCVGRRLSENLMYVAAIQMVQQFVLKKDPSFDITPLVRTQFTPGPELPVLFQER